VSRGSCFEDGGQEEAILILGKVIDKGVGDPVVACGGLLPDWAWSALRVPLGRLRRTLTLPAWQGEGQGGER
jgi:hypothetical protein